MTRRAICPITHLPIRDPVILETGCTYEREAIKQWLVKVASCPVTRASLGQITLLVPNRAVGTPSMHKAEPFATGPLTVTALSTLVATCFLPAVFEGLQRRLQFSPQIEGWKAKEAGSILPALAAALYHKRESTEVFDTVFASYASSVLAGPPGLGAVFAMKTLCDSVITNPAVLGAWREHAGALAQHATATDDDQYADEEIVFAPVL